MKKSILFVLVAVLLLGAKSYAQSFGIKGGLNLSKLSVSEEGVEEMPDFDYRIGFHAGLTADIPFSDMFSLDAGVLASTKGAVLNSSDTLYGELVEAKLSMNMLYVDVPVSLKARFPISDGASAYIAAGPYVGVGLTGNTKIKITVGSESEETTEDLEWGNEEAQVNRLDYGASFGAGVEFGSISVGASYGLGLANISNSAEAEIKHRVIGISVGYRFGGGGE